MAAIADRPAGNDLSSNDLPSMGRFREGKGKERGSQDEVLLALGTCQAEIWKDAAVCGFTRLRRSLGGD